MKTPIAVLCLLALVLSCMTTWSAAAEDKHQGTTRNVIDIKNHTKPKDATVLVGEGKHFLVPEKGDKTNWTYDPDTGILTASKGWDSLVTKDVYRDFVMHVEFNCNNNPSKGKEGNGNSGVYIQKRYEVQIQNAHGIPAEEFKHSYCGSLYKLKKPDKLVSKPAGQWQTYVIAFRAARFKGDSKVENARITVYHNGVVIHDDFEMPRKTGAGMKEGPNDQPIKLQGHANPVKFRNVWIKKINLD